MIRKTILLAITITASTHIKAQDYLGLSTGNYGGIQGVMLQPASVADNRYQYEINLVSGSLNFSNNYLGISRDYFFKNRFSFDGFESFQDFRSKVLTKDNSINEKVYMNVVNRINLPSLLLSTGTNSGIALNFQSRTGVAVRNLDPALANQIYSTWDDSSTYGQNYNSGGLDVSGMNWLEIGLTYGRVLMNKDEHFLKAGITAKYLGGISSMYFNADNLTARADNDSTLYLRSSQINYGHSPTNISGGINSSFRPDASTFGFDLGVVYEFRGRIDKFKFLKYDEENKMRIAKRRDKNKYTFKVGVSLLDVGKFRFKSVPRARNFAIDDAINLNAIDVRSIKDFDDEVQARGTYLSDSGAKYTVALPTAFSAQVDVHLYKGFYLNAMLYKPVSAFNYNADVRVYTPDYYAVTPHWESRVAGIYLPFVLNSKSEISAGATIRVGPVFVGTSNLLSFIEKDNIKAADLHAGLKIPIAFRKPGTFNPLLRKIIDDDDEDMGGNAYIPNESLFLKDTTAAPLQPEPAKVKQTKELQQSKAPAQQAPAMQQPINITINNYNSPNSATPSSSHTYKLDSANNMIPINNMLPGQAPPAPPAAPDMTELNKLQQQIDSLKQKLEQKEQLLKKVEEDRTEQNNSDSTDIKKKIPLKDDTTLVSVVTAGQNSDSSYDMDEYRRRIREMNATLDALNAKNEALDKQSGTDLLSQRPPAPESPAGGSPVSVSIPVKRDMQPADTVVAAKVQTQTIIVSPSQEKNADSLQRTAVKELRPKENQLPLQQPTAAKNGQQLPDSTLYNQYLQLQEENRQLKAQAGRQSAAKPLLAGNPSFDSVARREDINKLTREIATLQQQIADARERDNKPPEIIIKQTPSLVPNVMPTVGIGLGGGGQTKTVHDTVYIDKPAIPDTIVQHVTDTIVQTVRDTVLQKDTVVHEVRDTVVQTVVKDSTVTEVKIVDNLKQNLLSMPPLVLLFDVGKHHLKMVYQKRLDYYADQAKKAPDLILSITGHTDKTGSAAANLILSQKRAAAVTDYLRSKGVRTSQIRATASGEDEPIANNETGTGQSQNRRVEVVFQEAAR